MNTISPGLIDAARTGDGGGIDRLLHALWPDAYRLAYSILGEKAAAEDATQEACITIYRNIRSLRSAEAFRVWTYRIIVRAAMKTHRRVPGVAYIGNAPQVSDPVEIVDLWRALAEIPRDLRAAVVLRYFEDLNSREIGEVLGIPDATVRARLATAMRRLRPLLSDEDEIRQYAF